MFLKFTFSDNTTIQSEFILESAKITKCFYNELKYADDSASVKIPFNETLSDKIKADISKNIKVQIIENQTSMFTGYLRKTVNFTKAQRNKPISIEIVSPSFLLEKTYSGTVQHLAETTLGGIITFLLSLTDFDGQVDIRSVATKNVMLFVLHDGDKIKDVLSELLFEYGYTFNFDGNGNLYLDYIFETPSTAIVNKFNGDNCLDEIQQNVKEDKYDRVAVTYKKMQYLKDVLIFEDTTGADANNKAHIEIPKNTYYLGEQSNILKYSSKYNEIGWIESTKDTIKFDYADGITKSFINYGTQGELSIYNSAIVSNYINELSILGTGYFVTLQDEIKVGQSGTENSIETKYLQTEYDASLLAKKLADYYNYSNFTITVKSKTVFSLGSFVEVSDTGIGTIRCRVIKRVWDIQKNLYNYTLESVSEFNPVETYVHQQIVSSRGDASESIRDALSDLNNRVNNIVTDSTLISADILSAILNLDEQGKMINAQDITTTITLRQNDKDLEWSIGSIALPEGWTCDLNGNKITFHIPKGIKIRSGQFAIPVVYRLAVVQEYYTDENGNIYVDENGKKYMYQEFAQTYSIWNLYFSYYGDNGAIYVGLINELSQIPAQSNFGDYFTWSGSDVDSSLSSDGKFRQGRLYKFIGTAESYQWVEDKEDSHNQVALYDVLALANTNLQTNNSTVYEYMNTLTSSKVFTDLLVANSIFVDSLVGNTAFIQDLSSNTAFIKSIASNSAFIQDLSSNTAFINQLSANSLFTQNIKSINGLFDDLTVTTGLRFGNVVLGGSINDFISQLRTVLSKFKVIQTGSLVMYSCSGTLRFTKTIQTGAIISGTTDWTPTIKHYYTFSVNSLYIEWTNDNNVRNVYLYGLGKGHSESEQNVYKNGKYIVEYSNSTLSYEYYSINIQNFNTSSFSFLMQGYGNQTDKNINLLDGYNSGTLMLYI